MWLGEKNWVSDEASVGYDVDGLLAECVAVSPFELPEACAVKSPEGQCQRAQAHAPSGLRCDRGKTSLRLSRIRSASLWTRSETFSKRNLMWTTLTCCFSSLVRQFDAVLFGEGNGSRVNTTNVGCQVGF
eukprot:Polyplicarium_translucidae@DN3320_c3_g1_i5.p2